MHRNTQGNALQTETDLKAAETIILITFYAEADGIV